MQVDRKVEDFKKPFEFYVKALVGIVGLVFIWRGVWGLLDLYFLPQSPGLSRALSILIGMVLVVVLADIATIA